MRCGHCEMNVSNAVKALSGVASASADRLTGTLTVEYDDASLTPEAIKSAVESTGRYELTL